MSTQRDELEEIGKRIKREIDASTNNNSGGGGGGQAGHQIQMGRIRGQVVGPPGTVLNTITPCAACKLLRRRCAEECPFSPYFSPHEPQKFAAVHKIFGASNVSKMLLEVAESQRADAANSLVYEANVRLRDPVYGCMGVISSLQRQVQSLQAELNAVRSEIFKFKFRDATVATNANSVISTATTGPPLHHTSLVANSAGGGAMPQPQPPTTPPLVSVAASPPASNLYTPHTSTTGGFTSISSDSVAYFD